MESSSNARSFPVHYAALGFLMERPMHGYELRQRLRDGLRPFWHIASSQIYNVLHRLEEDGRITARIEAPEGRPPRTVYDITARGSSAYEAWVSSPVRHLRDLRVELFAKLYFLRRRSAEETRAFVAAQIEVLDGLDSKLARRRRLESDDAGLGAAGVAFRRHQLRSTADWLRASVENLVGTEENG